MELINTKPDTPPPVLLIGFNRPDKLEAALLHIIAAGITEIYISIDGPRSENLLDQNLCAKSVMVAHSFRSKFKKFEISISEINQGCKNGPKNAIDWFFERVNFGIIVEDDVLISVEFVKFTQDIRLKQRNDIWHINGWSFFKYADGITGAYESQLPLVWGWATWSDKWKNFKDSLEMLELDEITNTKSQFFKTMNQEFYKYWHNNFLNSSSIEAWDYFWLATIWSHNGKIISPPYRMTQNIGFDLAATHTKHGSNLLRAKYENLGKKYKTIAVNHIGLYEDYLMCNLVYRIPSKFGEVVSNLRCLRKVGKFRILGIYLNMRIFEFVVPLLIKGKQKLIIRN